MSSSKIFSRNRALGYVCNHVPCTTRYLKRRQETVIVSSVGKAFHSYGVNHLTLLSVSEPLSDEISCMVADRRWVFTAAGGKIQGWKRGVHVVSTFEGHDKPIHSLLLFGPLLISVCEDNVVKMWDRGSRELVSTLPMDAKTFNVSCLVHPQTYLNKIVFGSEQGGLELWNLKTMSMIHKFKPWDSSVLVLEQAPALDVLGIGLASGLIVIHNIKFDETLLEFSQDWGPVTGLAFRTDGPPILASSSPSGQIVLWDLEERRVASQITEAHEGSITTLKFLQGEPLLLSTSSDNSIKLWIFDQQDYTGRLLRFRAGHAAQPNVVRFCPSNPNHLFTTGGDSSLRVFNVISESMNFSMGRASYNRKSAKKKKEIAETLLMPQMTEMSVCPTREKEWDNIACLHSGSPFTTTWSYDKRRMGDHKLLPPQYAKATRVTLEVYASAVQITNCGNFVVVGYSSGEMERFNIQSGIHRCKYGDPKAHKGVVRGVAVDPLNQWVFSGCNEGLVKFWKFRIPKTPNLCPKSLAVLQLSDGISFFRIHQESSLMCAILEDFSISIIDYEMKKVVRKLEAHGGQVTDACFSSDARWVITSCMDGRIRTWDIPTASLIDVFKTDAPCISLSLSPTGQYLVTAHVNYLGVFLWSNKTLYSHVSLRPLTSSKSEAEVDLSELFTLDRGGVEDEEDEEEDDATTEPDQIGDLATFSNVASVFWKNLLNYEIIRQRNRPDESVLQKSVTAPFFLPQLAPTLTQDVRFDISTKEFEEEKAISKITLYEKTGLTQALDSSSMIYADLATRLASLPSSSLHYEIVSLEDPAHLGKFIKFLAWLLSTKTQIELAEAYLSVFLKAHTEACLSNPRLIDALCSLEESHSNVWETLKSEFMFNLSVIDSIRRFNATSIAM
uniref:WD repeat-containing protein 36 n=1 Tax=Lygus hesperus TaxID=30085 RepID=A0A0K8SL70_LYGHE